MKAEAYVTDADGDSYARHRRRRMPDNASLPKPARFCIFLRRATRSDAPQSGKPHLWLYADEWATGTFMNLKGNENEETCTAL